MHLAKLITGPLLLVLLTPLTYAEEFKIAGKKIEFFQYDEMRVTISKKCEDLNQKKLCKDLEFLNDISLSKAGITGTGTRNPGSTICTKLLGGRVVFGRDSENNENSFCHLKDGTYIDSGTLTYYAMKNEGLIKTPTRRK